MLFLSGCPSTYKIVVCISVPSKGGFNCSDGADKKFFLAYKDSTDYIALSADDAKTLLEKCDAWKNQ